MNPLTQRIKVRTPVFSPISLGNSFPLLSSLRRKGSQHAKWIQFGIKLKLPGKSFSLQLRGQVIVGRLSSFAVPNKGHDFSSWMGVWNITLDLLTQLYIATFSDTKAITCSTSKHAYSLDYLATVNHDIGYPRAKEFGLADTAIPVFFFSKL